MKIGVYIHDGFTFAPQNECPYTWGTSEYGRYLDWLKGAGVQIVEFCQQMGWYRHPTLPAELDRLRVRQGLVAGARRRGLEYWQILGTNLVSQLPWDQVPPGQLELSESDCVTCPQEKDGFRRTAELGQYFTRCFHGAQAFEIFAGDWGGCGCGRCDIEQYLQYVQWHACYLAEEQPAARTWANLWSISSWQKRPGGPVASLSDPRWRRFWDDEIVFSEQFISALDRIPPQVGIAFPLHHWYRGFCQQWYRQEELPFWPGLDLLGELSRAGRPLVAWTHFIVENDPYHGRLWGTLSVRLRYLKRLCGLLSQAPFEAVMGNVYSARQALNLYAFARFCRQSDLPLEGVLGDFVDQVALPGGRERLYNLLVYLENRDPWQEDLPNYMRLPPMPEEHTLSRQALQAALEGLEGCLQQDSPLLLNGPEHFARSVAAAFSLHEGR